MPAYRVRAFIGDGCVIPPFILVASFLILFKFLKGKISSKPLKTVSSHSSFFFFFFFAIFKRLRELTFFIIGKHLYQKTCKITRRIESFNPKSGKNWFNKWEGQTQWKTDAKYGKITLKKWEEVSRKGEGLSQKMGKTQSESLKESVKEWKRLRQNQEHHAA